MTGDVQLAIEVVVTFLIGVLAWPLALLLVYQGLGGTTPAPAAFMFFGALLSVMSSFFWFLAREQFLLKGTNK